MEASKAKLLEFMRVRKQQFVVPIFQRRYSWNIEQCRQLWNDICQISKHGEAEHHFIGSVIYIHEGVYHQSSFKQLMIIDGQQRITTISLLLVAIAKATSDGDLKAEIFDYYLLNERQTDSARYKLLLTRGDRETLQGLVDGAPISNDSSSKIIGNFRWFEQQVAQTKLDLNAIYDGIEKLLIVDVGLDRTHDDPQRIFESMNTTGLGLYESDKIRNFALMGLEPKRQEELYTKHWYPMEKRFGQAEAQNETDWFIRDYLTAKTGEIPNIRAVYPSFKDHLRDKDLKIAHLLHELEIFSHYYQQWLLPHQCDDPAIRQSVNNLKVLRVNVARPMLLELFDDHERRGRLSMEALREIIQLVESYVVRRAVCRIPTNTLNKTFATFLRQVKKNDYLTEVKRRFLEMDRNRRFPKDSDFYDGLRMNPLYLGRRERLQFLLTRLENYGRKERVNIGDYTIEHILPKNPNLSQEWREMLGEDWRTVQETTVHTLSNLTLTGYNSEMSDRPFREKRDLEGGFANSPLWLNKGLGQLSNWTEVEMADRIDRLYERALQIWPYPQLDE